MKINQGSIEITEVPGVDKITVAAPGGGVHGVHVLIAYTGGSADSYNLDDLAEHIAALQAALDRGQKMEQEIGPNSWQSLRDIPAWVARVVDADGDPHHRPPGGWSVYAESDDIYAPFTLARGD